MTIRLLRPFNGIPANSIVDLDRATEVALVNQLAASTTLTGGLQYVPNAPFDSERVPVESESFGASPSASSGDNFAAINQALASSGACTLLTPGRYLVTALPTVPANASLQLGQGVTLVSDAGVSLSGPTVLNNMVSSVLINANTGVSSAWIPYTPGMRLAYALSSGSTLTNFTVDISADGVTSLGQAFSGTWSSSAAYEISPPIWLTNVQARYIRFNIVSGGPLTVDAHV